MKNEIIPYQEKEFDLESFNEETRRLDALNYNIFLNDKTFNGYSIVDMIYKMQHYVHSKKFNKINKRLTNESSINLVLEFYDKIGLKEKLEKILTGKHPTFTTIISKNSEESYVGHTGHDKTITFSVGEMGTYNGISILVHESAHALNGFYTKFANLLNKYNKMVKTFGENSKEAKDVDTSILNHINNSKHPLNDCITEIDSHIAEMLFLEYAVDKNLISPEDKQVYNQMNINSLKNNIVQTILDDHIYYNIRKIKEESNNKFNEITEGEYFKLKEKLLSQKHGQDFIERLNFISKCKSSNIKQYNCKHKLRYVVATIFSYVWIDKYNQSNKQEKQKMLQNYKSFLLKIDKLDLDNSLSLLLPNETYESTINKFAKIINPKTQELSQ